MRTSRRLGAYFLAFLALAFAAAARLARQGPAARSTVRLQASSLRAPSTASSSRAGYPVVSVPQLDARTLNRRLVSLFDGLASRGGDVSVIRQFVAEHDSRLDHIHVLTLLHRCAKARIPVSRVLSWTRAADALEAAQCRFDAQSVGTCLYSLQHYSDEDSAREEEGEPGFTRFLNVLADKLEDSGSVNLGGQAVGNSLYGLQKWRGQTRASQRVISALAQLLERTAAAASAVSGTGTGPSSGLRLSGQELANALWGLQGLTSDGDASARRLVTALANVVTASEEAAARAEAGAGPGLELLRLSSQQVGMALWGLRGQSSDERSMQRLLAALSARFALTGCPALDPQAVGNGLSGLQRSSSDAAPVAALLLQLSAGIAADARPLDEQELACALSGLQRMHARSAAVEAVLGSLSRRLDSAPAKLASGPVSPRGLAGAVFGLKSMTSEDSPAVEAMAASLARIAAASNGASKQQSFSPQSLAMFLTGVRGLSPKQPSTSALLAAATSWVFAANGDCQALSGAEVGMCLSGLRRLDCREPAARALLAALAQRVALAAPGLSGSDLSAALGGLGGLRGDCEASRSLLAALSSRWAATSSTAISLTSGQACVALYGLRGFLASSASPAPAQHRQLLDNLVVFLSGQIAAGALVPAAGQRESGDDGDGYESDFYGRSFGLAAFSLAGALDSNSLASPRSALDAFSQLLARLESRAAALDPPSIAMAMRALASLRARSDAQVLAEPLGARIGASLDSLTTPLGGRELAACLSSLRGVGVSQSQADACVREILVALARNADKDASSAAAAFSSSQTRAISESATALDPAVPEVRVLLSSLARRLRRATKLEIQGGLACFVPVAPLLVGFFLAQEQLSFFSPIVPPVLM